MIAGDAASDRISFKHVVPTIRPLRAAASLMLLVHHVLASELYQALETLGAPPDLLSVVSSWGDGLDDAKVLELLQAWNRRGELETPLLH
jgi:hypothetical protein